MQPTSLVEVAAGNQPLIDIDGTVIIQFVLFAVMWFAANKLLFQPYLKLRAKRIAGIDGARAEAERMSAEADGKLADYESKLSAARAKAAAEQRKIRAEAAASARCRTRRAPRPRPRWRPPPRRSSARPRPPVPSWSRRPS